MNKWLTYKRLTYKRLKPGNGICILDKQLWPPTTDSVKAFTKKKKKSEI